MAKALDTFPRATHFYPSCKSKAGSHEREINKQAFSEAKSGNEITLALSIPEALGRRTGGAEIVVIRAAHDTKRLGRCSFPRNAQHAFVIVGKRFRHTAGTGASPGLGPGSLNRNCFFYLRRWRHVLARYHPVDAFFVRGGGGFRQGANTKGGHGHEWQYRPQQQSVSHNWERQRCRALRTKNRHDLLSLTEQPTDYS